MKNLSINLNHYCFFHYQSPSFFGINNKFTFIYKILFAYIISYPHYDSIKKKNALEVFKRHRQYLAKRTYSLQFQEHTFKKSITSV